MKLKQKRVDFINSTVGNNSQYVKGCLSMGAHWGGDVQLQGRPQKFSPGGKVYIIHILYI